MNMAVIAGLALPAALVYLAPAIIACARRLPRAPRILGLVLLTGWTVAGWAVCLVMSVRSRPDLPPPS